MDLTTEEKFPARRNPRSKSVDWLAVRKEFIESTERQTYEEVAAKFDISRQRVQAVAQDEGWAMLRAQRLDGLLRNGDAQLALLRAAKTDQLIMGKFSGVAVELLDQIQQVLQAETKNATAKEKAAGTRMNALNTASFALSNVARALKEVGVVGMPKVLKDAADKGNGRWSPDMVAALNVTVQNLMSADAKPTVTVEAVAAPAAAEPEDDDPGSTVL